MPVLANISCPEVSARSLVSWLRATSRKFVSSLAAREHQHCHPVTHKVAMLTFEGPSAARMVDAEASSLRPANCGAAHTRHRFEKYVR